MYARKRKGLRFSLTRRISERTDIKAMLRVSVPILVQKKSVATSPSHDRAYVCVYIHIYVDMQDNSSILSSSEIRITTYTFDVND